MCILVILMGKYLEVESKFGNKDLYITLIFAAMILLTQFIVDGFTEHMLEFIFAIKVKEYLQDCQHNFKNRRSRWVLNDPLEVVDPKWGGNREFREQKKAFLMIHQMCFSEQFYFLSSLVTLALLLGSYAFFMMFTAMENTPRYYPFSDQIGMILVAMTLFFCWAVQVTLAKLANYLGIWKVHERHDDKVTPVSGGKESSEALFGDVSSKLSTKESTSPSEDMLSDYEFKDRLQKRLQHAPDQHEPYASMISNTFNSDLSDLVRVQIGDIARSQTIPFKRDRMVELVAALSKARVPSMMDVSSIANAKESKERAGFESLPQRHPHFQPTRVFQKAPTNSEKHLRASAMPAGDASSRDSLYVVPEGTPSISFQARSSVSAGLSVVSTPVASSEAWPRELIFLIDEKAAAT